MKVTNIKPKDILGFEIKEGNKLWSYNGLGKVTAFIEKGWWYIRTAEGIRTGMDGSGNLKFGEIHLRYKKAVDRLRERQLVALPRILSFLQSGYFLTVGEREFITRHDLKITRLKNGWMVY